MPLLAFPGLSSLTAYVHYLHSRYRGSAHLLRLASWAICRRCARIHSLSLWLCLDNPFDSSLARELAGALVRLAFAWSLRNSEITITIAVTTVRKLCLAMDALSGCLASNPLLLNPTKTQFIWLGSRRRLANVDRCLVAQAFPHLVFCDNVLDPGIILDQELNFF